MTIRSSCSFIAQVRVKQFHLFKDIQLFHTYSFKENYCKNSMLDKAIIPSNYDNIKPNISHEN